MLCVRAPLLEERLINLAQSTGQTKSHFVRVALQALFDSLEKEPLLNLPIHNFDSPYLLENNA